MLSQNFGTLAVFLLFLVNYAFARLPDGRMNGNMMRKASTPHVAALLNTIPVTSCNGSILPPYDTVYCFDQLIDHSNPTLGTFKQRFWHTYEFYEQGMCLRTGTGFWANSTN